MTGACYGYIVKKLTAVPAVISHRSFLLKTAPKSRKDYFNEINSHKAFGHFDTSHQCVHINDRLASFAQAINQDKQNLKLISIVSQPDCPLVLTPAGVDDSNEGITVLKFDVRNFSERKIKAFSISRSMLGDEKIRGLITFIISFNAGETTEGWASEAKVNINSDSKILLAVDYVLFDDGGFWGKDSEKSLDLFQPIPKGKRKLCQKLKN